jgi:hypothetical protein
MNISKIKLAPLHIATLCALLFIAYALHFFIYATNAPRWDDYYDALYFLYLFDHAPGFFNKLDTLLWQYHEHKTIYGRLIYLTCYWLNGRIDFFYLSLVGIMQLLPAAWLLWAIMQLPDNQTTRQPDNQTTRQPDNQTTRY